MTFKIIITLITQTTNTRQSFIRKEYCKPITIAETSRSKEEKDTVLEMLDILVANTINKISINKSL
ncbi:hypothetical protein GCM10007894_08430 [Paraferrimonas haliotis]|uniref:Uncharacterized protein n=1 Tax=Paraferrimonas haliotis TaxID=2013866 RepID=A0AA37WY96_9GAMM|nr:hypothetical protein GCM10007894_08430 [Paraferrimonas haliotis]